MENLKRAELFSYHKRRVVRKHYSAGADTDFLCPASNVTDQDRCGRAWRCLRCCDVQPARSGDGRETVRASASFQSFARKSVADGPAFFDGREIQN